MKRFYILSLSVLLLYYTQSSANANWKTASEQADYIHRSIKEVTDVIVHDIFSPPVASRIYAYISVAGYEVARYQNLKYISVASQLHALTPVPRPEPGKDYSYSLASVHAILSVGKTLVISEEKVEEFHKNILQEFKETGMPEQIFSNSLLFGKQVADHILEWASKDNYKQIKSMPRYSVSYEASAWKPTPPAYMKAVEPNWNKLRPFLLQSAQQFKPLPPTPFSTNKNSRFFKEASKVFNTGSKLTPAQIEVANFWDCNPFKMNINGHVMYATKKISPGGHWINITRLACKKVKADLVRSAEAYACVSITLADCFISCWDEKYRSNVIRPETYINQYIDPNWTPLLQTPPFPEYTSGHSVVSSASAIVLTKLFGHDFSFADSTEVEFNLPVRYFKSFKLAAEEAAISRFYGGIHYMPSIKNGMEEGNKIGNFISIKLKTRKEDFVHIQK